MKKDRIDSFDFMRSITAWIIVIYHFAGICNTTPQYYNFPFFYNHANGVWGENTSVNIFFMLSGASLYYNYSQFQFSSLKKYYFGRFKGLFPMFYMIWFFLFYQNATTAETIFYKGNPKSLLLTLCGMDGYLSYRYPNNYYIIGEWFFGALVGLSLIYPLLTLCMKYCKVVVTLFLCLATVAFHWPIPYFQIQRERNFLVCLFAFWLGMLFIQYKEQLSAKWITVPFSAIALLLLFVKVPLDPFLCAQLISIGLFLLFYQIGAYVMKTKRIRQLFLSTGNVSYAIFLLQHVVMSQILGLFLSYKLTLWQECLILAATFFFIYLFSNICVTLNKTILNSKPFQKIERFILDTPNFKQTKKNA